MCQQHPTTEPAPVPPPIIIDSLASCLPPEEETRAALAAKREAEPIRLVWIAGMLPFDSGGVARYNERTGEWL